MRPPSASCRSPPCASSTLHLQPHRKQNREEDKAHHRNLSVVDLSASRFSSPLSCSHFSPCLSAPCHTEHPQEGGRESFDSSVVITLQRWTFGFCQFCFLLFCFLHRPQPQPKGPILPGLIYQVISDRTTAKTID